MNWHEINLGQFQDVYSLTQDKSMDEMQKLDRIICIIFDLTDKQLGELTINDYNKKARDCSFLLKNNEIPGKAVKRLKVGRKVYKVEYDPTKLKHRQYVEILTYGERPIDNMHLIMASLVKPVKFGIARKNNVSKHAEIAEDMQGVKLCNIYHSCVFFCKLYRNLMQTLASSLIEAMMKTKKVTRDEAQQLIAISLSAMDGFIPRSN